MSAGNTRTEARTQGLSEVFERHVKNKIIAEAISLPEIPSEVIARYPGIKARLVKDDQVDRFVNIYVNDDDIRFADGLATPIRPGDQLTVLPAVAGG